MLQIVTYFHPFYVENQRKRLLELLNDMHFQELDSQKFVFLYFTPSKYISHLLRLRI